MARSRDAFKNIPQIKMANTLKGAADQEVMISVSHVTVLTQSTWFEAA